MAKFADPLEYSTDVCLSITRKGESELGIDSRGACFRLPHVPHTFQRVTAYQRRHNTAKWFNNSLIPREINRNVTLRVPATELKTSDDQYQPKPFDPSVATYTDSRPLSYDSSAQSSNLCLSPVDLDDSDFDSEPEEEIPESQRRYSELQREYVRITNRMEVDRLNAVHRQLGTYHMDLQYCKLRDREFKSIVVTLMSEDFPHNILRLDLTNTRMGDDTKIAYLCDFLRVNSTIKDLILRNNGLAYRHLRPLCSVLLDLDNIAYLDLSENNMGDDCGMLVAKLLEGCSTLETLLVSHNQFTEATAKLFTVVSDNPYLRLLDVSYNIMTGKGLSSFIRGVSKNQYLECLNLSWNKLREDECKALKRLLAFNSMLRHLNVTGAGITSDNLRILMSGLDKNTTLETIKLDQNAILVEDLKWFLKGILAMSSTTALYRIDLTNMCVEETHLRLVDELMRRHIVVKYLDVVGESKQKNVQTLVKRLMRNKAEYEVNGMKEALRGLDQEMREKVAKYLITLDLQLVKDGGERSFFLKATAAGFVDQAVLAVRIVEQERDLSDIVLELTDLNVPDPYISMKGRVGTTNSLTHCLTTHVVSHYDPMDFYTTREFELQAYFSAIDNGITYTNRSRRVTFEN